MIATVLQSDLLDDLLEVASEASAMERTTVRSIADLILASPDAGRPPRRGRSGLNNDGSPIELCLSSFADACRVRLVADPASSEDDAVTRRDRSLHALRALLERTGSLELAPLCEATLLALVPDDDRTIRDVYTEGVLWLGAGLGMPGVAMYVDATKGELDERWQRVESWAGSLLADAGPARAAIASLAAHGDVMSVGIEGTSASTARAKIFWRLTRPLHFAELGTPFAEPPFARFFAVVAGERDLPLQSLVVSTSFLVATGAQFDAKLDICAHCLGLDEEQWVALVSELTAAFSLAPIDVRAALSGGRTTPAFLGLNRNGLGQFRLDLFLKPSRWYREIA